MAGQARLNIDLTPFVLGGLPYFKGGTLAQDAGRSTDLAQYTVMAFVTADEEWVPLTDIDALDGSFKPRAIYVGADVAAADIVAGTVDVEEGSLLIGGSHVRVDLNKIVLENSLTLSDNIEIVDTGGTNQVLGSIEDCLRELGIYMGDVVEASAYENS